MAGPRNVGREIALSLLAAVLFGAGLYAYLLHTIPSKEELLAQAPAVSEKLTPAAPEFVAATAVVEGFAHALGQKDYAAAYALMAQPYRDAVAPDAFQKACEASSFLAGAQSAILRSTHRMAVPAGPYTEQGRALLVTRLGSVDANFTFLVNGADMRILVLSLAGVPVLDGVNAGRVR